MNIAIEIKDLLDFLSELQTLAIEDAGLAFRNKDFSLQNERLIIAYTLSNAVASLNTLYLPILLQSDKGHIATEQQTLHICQLQKLLTSIHLYTLKGDPIKGVNTALFTSSIQQAIECYSPNS